MHGYAGARYKKFNTQEEAQAFVDGHDDTSSNNSSSNYTRSSSHTSSSCTSKFEQSSEQYSFSSKSRVDSSHFTHTKQKKHTSGHRSSPYSCNSRQYSSSSSSFTGLLIFLIPPDFCGFFKINLIFECLYHVTLFTTPLSILKILFFTCYFKKSNSSRIQPWRYRGGSCVHRWLLFEQWTGLFSGGGWSVLGSQSSKVWMDHPHYLSFLVPFFFFITIYEFTLINYFQFSEFWLRLYTCSTRKLPSHSFHDICFDRYMKI